MNYNREGTGSLNLNNVKLIYKLINRFNKKMPYNDNFQPLYDSGIHQAFNPWIDIEKINNVYYMFYNNQTPVMPLPPLTTSGEYPSIEETLLGLVTIRDKMKNGNFKGTKVRINSYHTNCLKNFYGKIPGVKHETWDIDYVYDINNHSSLYGKTFARIRKDINKFKRENITHIIDIKPKKQINEIMLLNYSSIEGSNWNAQILKSTINNFNKLKKIIKEMNGFIIVDDNENIIGVEVSYKVKHTSTLISYIKRSSHNYRGLSNYIDQLAAIKAKERYPSLKFVNMAANKSGKSGLYKKDLNPIRYEHGSSLILK